MSDGPNTPSPDRTGARFGVFDVDFRTGELRKAGIRIRLQEQPFLILAALLERPGELVTRDELRGRLWSDVTFMDFDHGINVAVKKLRRALNDSVDSPRYIETLGSKGYRFIAPVELLGAPVAKTDAHAATTPVTARRWVARRFVLVMAGVAAGVPLVVIATGLYRGTPPPMRVSTLESDAGSFGGPVLSPDGTQVVFSNDHQVGPRKLYIKTIGSGAARRLTDDTSPSMEIDPAFTPDGAGISFVRREPNTDAALYVVALNGGAPRKVVVLGPNSGYTWMRDGKAVVAGLVEPNGYLSSLYSVTIASGHRERRTTPPPALPNTGLPGGDLNPQLSPDGTMIAFLRRASHLTLMVTAVAGGPAREVVRFDSDLYSRDLYCWSADSRTLIYSAFDESAASNLLYRVPVPGGKAEVLPFAGPGLDLLGANVSQRGRRLVYVIPSERWAIWRYELPGRGQTTPASRLLEFTRVVGDPTWSPNGSKFAFASIGRGTYQIYTANADGSHQAQLTFMRGSMTGWPKWSPDGRQISFDSRPQGHSQVFVVDAEGGTPRAITPADQESVMPEWSVDGEWIYFTCLAPDGASNIRRVPSRGGPVSTVYAGNAYGSFPSPDGTLLYFTNRTTKTMYSIPIAGGNPEEVGDFGRAGFLTIAKSGIYYLTPRRSATDRKPDLMCYRFATKRSEFVITLDQTPQSPALGVSADERELLYATSGGTVSRIMLVENFH